MSIISTLLLIVILTSVLNILIIQSNNFIFMFFRKPFLWIIFMGIFSFIYFWVGSQFENSFNLVWWSAFLAFLLNIPPKAKKESGVSQKENNELADEMYNDMGIKKGRLKYRLGLIAYVVCGIIGWVIFYGEIITIFN